MLCAVGAADVRSGNQIVAGDVQEMDGEGEGAGDGVLLGVRGVGGPGSVPAHRVRTVPTVVDGAGAPAGVRGGSRVPVQRQGHDAALLHTSTRRVSGVRETRDWETASSRGAGNEGAQRDGPVTRRGGGLGGVAGAVVLRRGGAAAKARVRSMGGDGDGGAGGVGATVAHATHTRCHIHIHTHHTHNTP